MNKLVSMTLVAALCLSGCGTIKRAVPEEGNKSVLQIDQAASLHTSITSITPWEDIKDKLKPDFALSANDALAKSIPTTLVRLDRVLDILKYQLALTPSITKESSTITTSSGTGKEPTTATDSKREKSSPELPTVAPPSGLSASAPASVSGPDTSADALLQYQTAANLLRDIAVLNSEIDNVSRRTGQDAFLTRIQVSVMPLRRGLGYDVYANLSMFASSGSFDPTTGKRTVGELLPAVHLAVPILSTDSLQAPAAVLAGRWPKGLHGERSRVPAGRGGPEQPGASDRGDQRRPEQLRLWRAVPRALSNVWFLRHSGGLQNEEHSAQTASAGPPGAHYPLHVPDL